MFLRWTIAILIIRFIVSGVSIVIFFTRNKCVPWFDTGNPWRFYRPFRNSGCQFRPKVSISTSERGRWWCIFERWTVGVICKLWARTSLHQIKYLYRNYHQFNNTTYKYKSADCRIIFFYLKVNDPLISSRVRVDDSL